MKFRMFFKDDFLSMRWCERCLYMDGTMYGVQFVKMKTLPTFVDHYKGQHYKGPAIACNLKGSLLDYISLKFQLKDRNPMKLGW